MALCLHLDHLPGITALLESEDTKWDILKEFEKEPSCMLGYLFTFQKV